MCVSNASVELLHKWEFSFHKDVFLLKYNMLLLFESDILCLGLSKLGFIKRPIQLTDLNKPNEKLSVHSDV